MSESISEKYKCACFVLGEPVPAPELLETLRLMYSDQKFQNEYVETLRCYEESESNDPHSDDPFKALITVHLKRIGYVFESVPLSDLGELLADIKRHTDFGGGKYVV